MSTQKIVLFAVSMAVNVIMVGAAAGFSQTVAIPPAEDQVLDRLNRSPRHGEWVVVDAGSGDAVDAWLVYPERSDNAPVVVVIHEIYGLTDWIRAVADHMAAEGFIAIAPDLLSGKGPGGKGSSSVSKDDARRMVRELSWEEITRRLDATARYATSLPAATKKVGTVGFCWGGGTSFRYATEKPDLDAAVVYYGVSPEKETLAGVRAPVLGLYGGGDQRVNATIPQAESEMNRLGNRFEYEIYSGAGHAFLRNQSGKNGVNLKAAEKAWPRMVRFLQDTLGA